MESCDTTLNIVENLRVICPVGDDMLTTPFVLSKIDPLSMYCQHLIISIVSLNLLMKQKVETSYPSQMCS